MYSGLSYLVNSGRINVTKRLKLNGRLRRTGFQQPSIWASLSSCLPHNFHSLSSRNQKSTPILLSPYAAATIAFDDEDDEVDLFSSQSTPNGTVNGPLSSLDLELGEGSRWDMPHGDLWEEEDASIQSETRQRLSAMDMLMRFDPQNPPLTDDPDELQLWLECQAQQEAVLTYQNVIDSARERKDYSSLSIVQRQVIRWFAPLRDAVERRQRSYILNESDQRSKASTRYGPFMCVLSPEKLAVITAHEAIMCTLLKDEMRGRTDAGFTTVASRIGQAVEDELLIQRTLYKRFRTSQIENSMSKEDPGEGAASLDEDTGMQWVYAASHLKQYFNEINDGNFVFKKRRMIKYALHRARQVLELEDAWSDADKVHLGAALFQGLLETATVLEDGREQMAFTYEAHWTKGKLRSIVTINERLRKMITSDKLHSLSSTSTKHKPMVRPPLPWGGLKQGGYLWLKTDLVRFHGCNTQKEALRNSDLSTVFEGLNALGRVPWKINREVFDVARRCWEEGIAIGDIPTRTDFVVPSEPVRPQIDSRGMDRDSSGHKEFVQEFQKYKQALHKYNRIRQKNNDLLSLRCSAMLKLDQAEKFQDFEKIYFPYNMDFRGRAYPIPPHLSNVGSDLCRGMLSFAEAKPLGPRGLYWLKVHLANLAGMNKMSFDARALLIEKHMDKVRCSAEDPFAGERWWISLDDPFQGLATCKEIIKAIDSGDPESYLCSLPVHMDGSCNGLQHYAALGRDPVGGRSVNLCSTEEPQDVYLGVMEEVIRRVALEAERTLDFDTSNMEELSRDQRNAFRDNRAAKLVSGLIDRGVVKRTVMTSVYGVTYVGARQQIQEKLEEKLAAKGYDPDEHSDRVFQASSYLARVTMSVMGELFVGARETMNWLTACAQLIAQHGYPVAWISPIGVSAIQPYRQKKSSILVTLLQTVNLNDNNDDLPIHRHRQVTAFPPNFIHSLDSSHMLLTALEMDRRGLTFSAVHDSFWTHPCDVDVMNEALREVFVSLYEQPILERQRQEWQLRYPDIEFPEVPKRGSLDLNEVKDAIYFFQ